MVKQVIVAGAGAAGLMAAVTAARSGAKVTILEAMERPGRKLLTTGNGRCNLTNLDPNLPSAYHSNEKAFPAKVISQFPPEETLAFFREIGLLTADRNGYVYPYTNQASSVLEVLLAEARRLKVKIKLSEKIERIDPDGDGWKVQTATWTYSCDRLILCCGSKCMPQTGSDGSGYQLAASVGLAMQPAAPALTPLICSGTFLPALAGVRCHAKITLFRKVRMGRTAAEASAKPVGKASSKKKGVSAVQRLDQDPAWEMAASETGELQWTKYGISGIAVFQLSRYVSTSINREEFAVQIDLLDSFSEEELRILLQKRARMLAQEKVSCLLQGILPEKLIPVFVEKAGFSLKKTCDSFTEAEITALIAACRFFSMRVTGTKEFDTCQVCAGGVLTSEVSAETLECRKLPGLYIAGEMMDVDGPCGGYNLQWAWSSGYVAGVHAAR